MNLFTPAWWESAGARAANTAIAALTPLVLLLWSGDATIWYVASVTGVAVLGSFVTSLAGLPEVTGRTVPLWKAVLSRSAKTLGQTLAGALVGVVVLTDVDWTAVMVTVGGAVTVTLLRTLAQYLPEQEPTGDTGDLTLEGDLVFPDDGPRHSAG